MGSPGARPRRPSTPSFLALLDEHAYPVPTRSGALASLIRSRSSASLNNNGSSSSAVRHPRDEEALCVRRGSLNDEDDISRLLQNEDRLNQILHGTRARSKNLIGKSNPRYRWGRYWKHETELKDMSKPM